MLRFNICNQRRIISILSLSNYRLGNWSAWNRSQMRGDQQLLSFCWDKEKIWEQLWLKSFSHRGTKLTRRFSPHLHTFWSRPTLVPPWAVECWYKNFLYRKWFWSTITANFRLSKSWHLKARPVMNQEALSRYRKDFVTQHITISLLLVFIWRKYDYLRRCLAHKTARLGNVGELSKTSLIQKCDFSRQY